MTNEEPKISSSKFFENLKNIYGIDQNDFYLNYQYAGGDGQITSYNEHKILQLKGETLYATLRGITKKMMMSKELNTNQCVCGHYIKNHCYVQHKNDKSKIIVLGNVCILKFKGKHRYCQCGKMHKNRKTNLCNDCRGITTKITYLCECGSEIQLKSKKRHNKSKKHINFLNNKI